MKERTAFLLRLNTWLPGLHFSLWAEKKEKKEKKTKKRKTFGPKFKTSRDMADKCGWNISLLACGRLWAKRKRPPWIKSQMLPFRLLSLLLFCQISESRPSDLYAEMPPTPTEDMSLPQTKSRSLCEIWPLIIEVMPYLLVTWAIPTPPHIPLFELHKGEVYSCLWIQFVTLSVVCKFVHWCCCFVPHSLLTWPAWRG